MTITLQEVRSCLEKLLEMTEAHGLQAVESRDRDLYWTILSEEWLNFQREPIPAVGSLDEDIRELKRLLSDPQSANSADLVRLAAILMLLSEELDRYGRWR